jgi:hypothetical protein
LPQFLPTGGIGAPAIGVFFDIFIGKHGLEGPATVVQIQEILDEKPVPDQSGEEEFIDPFPHALAYLHLFVRGRSGMASHYHADDVSKPSATSSHPPSKSSLTWPVFMLLTLAVGG